MLLDLSSAFEMVSSEIPYFSPLGCGYYWCCSFLAFFPSLWQTIVHFSSGVSINYRRAKARCPPGICSWAIIIHNLHTTYYLWDLTGHCFMYLCWIILEWIFITFGLSHPNIHNLYTFSTWSICPNWQNFCLRAWKRLAQLTIFLLIWPVRLMVLTSNHQVLLNI